MKTPIGNPAMRLIKINVLSKSIWPETHFWTGFRDDLKSPDNRNRNRKQAFWLRMIQSHKFDHWFQF